MCSGWKALTDDALILERQPVYEGWLRLHRVALRMPDGAVEERHVEDHGEAAVVLLYDPARKTGLVITQPRAPVLLAGEQALIEAVAGSLDGRSPEDAARAEAMEEAGVRLGALEFVARVWTMPSISTERVHLFLAAYSPADRVGPGGGSEHENESITVHELSLAELWARTEAGELPDGKTLILLQALHIRRPELFVR